MEAYRRETKEIIGWFRAGRISRSECESALNAALAGVLPRIGSEHLDVLRTVLVVNCEAVVDEIERRRALVG